MATKIIINDTMFTFEEDGLQFDTIIENGRIKSITDVREGKMKKPEDKYVTNASAAGQAALHTLEKAIMAEPMIQSWEVDDIPVTVCQSGGGYYAGCICFQGPYTRISGYSSGPALVLHWMYNMRVGLDTDPDKDNGFIDTNVQDAVADGRLTVGQAANMFSLDLIDDDDDDVGECEQTFDEVVNEIEEDNLEAQLAELKAVHAALMERMDKAIDCYKKLRSDYKQVQSNLHNANRANEHLRWLLTSHGISIN